MTSGGFLGGYATADVIAESQVRVNLWVVNSSGQAVLSDAGGFSNLTVTC